MENRSSSAGIMRASASANGGALTCDGVKLTQGLGDLPKVVLASPHGRSVNQFPNFIIIFFVNLEF